jgi:molecular chaperone GrpE
MTDKRAEETIHIDVSQEKSEDHYEDKSCEGGKNDSAKPLEKMSKRELLNQVKEFKDKSEKDYERFLRAQAEIENILKRNKKEKEEWVKYSNETLIKEILPVMDNLEKAVSHSKEDNSLHALKEGIELTLKGLKDTLVKSGLEEVKAEGEAFDPCFHHAVSERNDENVEAGIILDELQKGYTLNQRLIRPAMVILSKGRPEDEKSPNEMNFDRACED